MKSEPMTDHTTTPPTGEPVAEMSDDDLLSEYGHSVYVEGMYGPLDNERSKPMRAELLRRLALTRPAAPEGDMVLGEVAAERQRQMDAEGWTPEHDDRHVQGELAKAASCYANHRVYPAQWPNQWDERWYKPKGRRRDLIRAAALIVAEIERMDRAALAAPSGADHA